MLHAKRCLVGDRCWIDAELDGKRPQLFCFLGRRVYRDAEDSRGSNHFLRSGDSISISVNTFHYSANNHEESDLHRCELPEYRPESLLDIADASRLC